MHLRTSLACGFSALCLGSAALAQTPALPAHLPPGLAQAVTAQVQSSAPAPGAAPGAVPSMDGATQQLQQVLGKKNSQEGIGQAMALGILVNCTQKTAGKDATQAFYQQMQTVGENVKAACKRQDAAGAQQLVLSTLDAKKNDPVLKTALNCYDTQSGAINGMAGQKTADDIGRYVRWAKDPAAARSEMKPTDICHEHSNAAQ